jgi:hypothetical protein
MLYERGHNVVIPRLPYHGYRNRMTTAPAALTADDLKTCGLEGLAQARELVLPAAVAPATKHVTFVVNTSDGTVNNAAIDDLYRTWQSVPNGRFEMVRLKGLPISHDIIEPERAIDPVTTVYPRLLEVIGVAVSAS